MILLNQRKSYLEGPYFLRRPATVIFNRIIRLSLHAHRFKTQTTKIAAPSKVHITILYLITYRMSICQKEPKIILVNISSNYADIMLQGSNT